VPLRLATSQQLQRLYLAKAYANKTAKTVQRDLNALQKMELIVREPRRVKARREIILSFLPLRRRLPKKEGE